MIRVYKFGALPPVEGLDLVRAQMRAAHDYANDLTAIERGRRWAVRQIHDASPDVRHAADALRAATRTDRRERLRELSAERMRAEQRAPSADLESLARELAQSAERDGYDISALDATGTEMARIKALDGEIRRGARALTTAHWGTYLTIEASADQARKAPLYGDDGLEPAYPRFERRRGEGQIGVQLQGGLPTSDALACTDTQVRLEVQRSRVVGGSDGGAQKTIAEGELCLRVGSDGRAPIWARVPVRLHRQIPPATWKWVRLSLRRYATREVWSVEITADIDAPHPHTLDTSLERAIAVELMWSPLDDGGMRVASWLDSEGKRGTIDLDARMVDRLTKAASLRSLRDVLLNELRPKLATRIRESKDDVPSWLREAGNAMQYWKSPERFLALVQRWRRDKCDAARDAYELLQEWELRNEHLWEYEAGTRRRSLLCRREIYRVAAAQLARSYRTVLLPDRDLSREARFGEESDRRFLSAPQELRQALRNAFGPEGAVDVAWRGPHGVVDTGDEDDDPPEWKEMAIEQWRGGKIAVSARKKKKRSDVSGKPGGAWANRKAAKLARGSGNDTARETVGNDAK